MRFNDALQASQPIANRLEVNNGLPWIQEALLAPEVKNGAFKRDEKPSPLSITFRRGKMAHAFELNYKITWLRRLAKAEFIAKLASAFDQIRDEIVVERAHRIGRYAPVAVAQNTKLHVPEGRVRLVKGYVSLGLIGHSSERLQAKKPPLRFDSGPRQLLFPAPGR